MRRGPGCKAAPSGKATAPAVPRHLLTRTNRVPGVDAALAPDCAIWEQSVCWKIIRTPVHWPFGHSDEDPSSPLKGVLPTAGNTHGRARVVNRDILRSTILDGAPGGRPPGRLVSGVKVPPDRSTPRCVWARAVSELMSGGGCAGVTAEDCTAEDCPTEDCTSEDNTSEDCSAEDCTADDCTSEDYISEDRASED